MLNLVFSYILNLLVDTFGWYTQLSDQRFLFLTIHFSICPVGWGFRIHPLLLCRGVRPPHTHTHTMNILDYDTKQSDGEVPAMLELWGMWSTPLLPSLPGPLWLSVIAPDRFQSGATTLGQRSQRIKHTHITIIIIIIYSLRVFSHQH